MTNLEKKERLDEIIKELDELTNYKYLKDEDYHYYDRATVKTGIRLYGDFDELYKEYDTEDDFRNHILIKDNQLSEYLIKECVYYVENLIFSYFEYMLFEDMSEEVREKLNKLNDELQKMIKEEVKVELIDKQTYKIIVNDEQTTLTSKDIINEEDMINNIFKTLIILKDTKYYYINLDDINYKKIIDIVKVFLYYNKE